MNYPSNHLPSYLAAALLLAAVFAALNCVDLNLGFRWHLAALTVFLGLAVSQAFFSDFRPWLALARQPVFVCYSALMLWSGASLFWSIAPSHSLLYWLIQAGGILAISVGFHANPALWKQINNGLLFLALLIAAYTLYQGLQLHVDRPSGFMNNWNANAAFLALLILPACGRFLQTERTFKRLGLGSFLAVCAAAIAATQSRGGLLVLLWGLAPVVWLASRQGRSRSVGELMAYLALGFIASELVSEGGLSRRIGQIPLADTGQQAIQALGSGRHALWQAGWQMYLDKPWLGWGLGVYQWLYPRYRNPLLQEIGRQSHNDYLDTLLGLGPVGLLLLLLFAAAIARLAWRAFRLNALEQLCLANAALAILLHSFVDFDLYQPAFLLVVGLYCGQAAVHAATVPQGTPNLSTCRRLCAGFALLFGGLLLALWMGYYRLGQAYQAETPAPKMAFLSSAQQWLPYMALLDHEQLALIMPLVRQGRPADMAAGEWRALVDFALAKTEALAAKNSADAANYRNRGDLLALNATTARQWANVIGDYQRALSFNPYDLKARLRLATALENRGEAEAARRVLLDGLNRAYFEEVPQGQKLLQRIAAVFEETGASPQKKQALQAQILRFNTQHARFQYDNFVLEGV